MKTALLIVLLTLSGARKEAAKRWPAGAWTLRIDQTRTIYVYELEVRVPTVRDALMGKLCAMTTFVFKGKSWGAVFDAAKDVKPNCVEPK